MCKESKSIIVILKSIDRIIQTTSIGEGRKKSVEDVIYNQYRCRHCSHISNYLLTFLMRDSFRSTHSSQRLLNKIKTKKKNTLKMN